MKLRLVLDLLAPPLCAGCGAGAGEAEPLCGRCRRELRWLGREAVPIGGERLCEAWAPVAYEGGARGLVRALKFKGAMGAAGAMAAAMAAGAPDGWFGGGGAVVELV